MLASHANKTRVISSKWVPFGRRKVQLECSGKVITITAVVSGKFVPRAGEQLLLINAPLMNRPILGRSDLLGARLYINFEKHDITPDGGYAVWIEGRMLSKEDVFSRYKYPFSNEGFTFVEDETELILFVVSHGGKLINL